MGTTPNGIWYPESGDSTRIWELMRQQAESIPTTVSVANVGDRDAVAAALNPTPNRPLYVHRRDLPVGQAFQWTVNGEDWFTVHAGDTGWVPVTIASGYIAWDPSLYGAPAVRNKGGWTQWRGAITRDGASIPSGNTTIARAPASPLGLRPAHDQVFSGVGDISTRQVKVNINSEGAFIIGIPSANIPAWVALSPATYPGA